MAGMRLTFAMVQLAAVVVTSTDPVPDCSVQNGTGPSEPAVCNCGADPKVRCDSALGAEWCHAESQGAAEDTCYPVCDYQAGDEAHEMTYPCVCGTDDGELCDAEQWCDATRGEGDRCQYCPAGWELDTSASPGAGCVQCAVGYFSDHVGGRCKKLPAYAAGELTEPVLDVVRDATEDTTMTLTLAALPDPADLFQGHSLIYVIDVKPAVDDLPTIDDDLDVLANDPDRGLCHDHWTNTDTTSASLVVKYSELSGDCLLAYADDTVADGNITRKGVVGVYVVSVDTQGVEHWEHRWTINVNLQFKMETLSDLGSGGANGALGLESSFTLADRTFFLGDFASHLRLYPSAAYTGNPHGTPYSFDVGDPLHVEHRLENLEEDLLLEVVLVFLSTSVDPSDQASIVYDYTDVLMMHQDPPASISRFTIIARRCPEGEICILHVISDVVDNSGTRRRLLAPPGAAGRRLASPISTVQSIYVRISAPPQEPTSAPEPLPGGPRVQIRMLVQGLDYNGLVAQPALKGLVSDEIRDAVVDRVWYGNLQQAPTVVALSPGSVYADAEVRLPDGIDVAALRATLSAESFEPALENGVTEGVVGIEGIGVVTHGPISTDVVSIKVVEEDAPTSPEPVADSPAAVVATLVVCTCLVVLLVATGVLWRCVRKQERGEPKNTKVVEIVEATADLQWATEDLKKAYQEPPRPVSRSSSRPNSRASAAEQGKADEELPGMPHLVVEEGLPQEGDGEQELPGTPHLV